MSAVSSLCQYKSLTSRSRMILELYMLQLKIMLQQVCEKKLSGLLYIKFIIFRLNLCGLLHVRFIKTNFVWFITIYMSSFCCWFFFFLLLSSNYVFWWQPVKCNTKLWIVSDLSGALVYHCISSVWMAKPYIYIYIAVEYTHNQSQ